MRREEEIAARIAGHKALDQRLGIPGGEVARQGRRVVEEQDEGGEEQLARRDRQEAEGCGKPEPVARRRPLSAGLR
jgi:hypothetical protein